jgi:hypothetical protein
VITAIGIFLGRTLEERLEPDETTDTA